MFFNYRYDIRSQKKNIEKNNCISIRPHMDNADKQVYLSIAFFLRGKEGMLTSRPPTMEGLNQEQLEALFRMSTRYIILT
jgi:hypothetical protein